MSHKTIGEAGEEFRQACADFVQVVRQMIEPPMIRILDALTRLIERGR